MKYPQIIVIQENHIIEKLQLSIFISSQNSQKPQGRYGIKDHGRVPEALRLDQMEGGN